MPRVPTRLSRLSPVFALAGLASACTTQAVPPLARTAGLDVLTGKWPVTIAVAVVALALGLGVFALLRKRRSAGSDPSAAWSVLADIPGRDAASFSLPPVVEAPQAQDVPPDAAAPDENALDDDAPDDDTSTFWLDGPAEQESDDTVPLQLSSAAERMAGKPDKPWWIDDDSDLGAVPVDDSDDTGPEPLDDSADPGAGSPDDPDDLGAELLDDAGRWAGGAASRNAMFGPSSGA